jgi:hypothetical protein
LYSFSNNVSFVANNFSLILPDDSESLLLIKSKHSLTLFLYKPSCSVPLEPITTEINSFSDYSPNFIVDQVASQNQ